MAAEPAHSLSADIRSARGSAQGIKIALRRLRRDQRANAAHIALMQKARASMLLQLNDDKVAELDAALLDATELHARLGTHLHEVAALLERSQDAIRGASQIHRAARSLRLA